jgi:Ca2+-binding RTX toxin-like protein
VTYFFAAAGVTIDLGHGVATGEGKDTLVAVEAAYGSQYNDVLLGGPGADVLNGSWGQDLIHSSDGADVMIGNLGFDTLDFGAAASGVTVDLAADTANGQGADEVQAFEMVLGSPFADSLSGDLNTDYLYGGNGPDKLFGKNGADFLYGEGGSDTFNGGGGTDRCAGGAGTDSASLCENLFGIP